MKKTLPGLIFFFIALQTFSQTATISPTYGNRSQSLPVTITGTNTSFVQGSTSVTFFRSGSPTSFIQASPIAVSNSTLLGAVLNISANAPFGSYTFKVNTPTGSVSGLNFFQVTSTLTPQLVKIDPTSGKQGQTLPVTITGLGTHFNLASATSTIIVFIQGSNSSGIQVLSASAASSTLLMANIFISATASLGLYDLSIYNAFDGLMTLVQSFLVTPDDAINEVSNHLSELVLYPNPTVNQFNIQTVVNIKDVEITDLQGRTIPFQMETSLTGTRKVTLDDGLNRGHILIVRIVTEKGTICKKLFLSSNH
jgi:hypothetical protein